MKKSFVLKISFILIMAILFSAFSMNAAAGKVSIKDNPVPLDGAVGMFDDDADDATVANPKTGDNTVFFVLLGLTSLAAVSTAVAAAKKKPR